MPPHLLYDYASAVADLASLFRMAIAVDDPDPGLVLDRMRRLEDAFKTLRQATAEWVVKTGYPLDDRGDAIN